MIHDIDDTLRGLLSAELARIPGCPIENAGQITLLPPSHAVTDKPEPRINLYLHSIRENVGLRDDSFHKRRHRGEDRVGVRPAPVHFDLCYLVTAYSAEVPASEHRVLSDVLSVLLRFPSVPAHYLIGSLDGLGPNSVILQLAHPGDDSRQASWIDSAGQTKPVLHLIVTAPFDPFDTKWARVVKQAVIGMGFGVPPNGPRQPMDVSQISVSAAGIVIDQRTEQPLAGAEITEKTHTKRATTDDQGFFYLTDLPPGRYTLTVHRRGYQSRDEQVNVHPSSRVDLLDPLVVGLTLMSAEQHRAELIRDIETGVPEPELVNTEQVHTMNLAGVLRFRNGKPGAYIPVRVNLNRTISNAAGAYMLTGLKPGEHRVVAEVAGVGDVAVVEPDGDPLLEPDVNRDQNPPATGG